MTTCENCKHWARVQVERGKIPTIGAGGPPALGQCRRRAPQAAVPIAAVPQGVVGQVVNFQGGTTAWPLTEAREWCGEAEAVPTDPERLQLALLPKPPLP